jgi:hypothetical protein
MTERLFLPRSKCINHKFLPSQAMAERLFSTPALMSIQLNPMPYLRGGSDKQSVFVGDTSTDEGGNN